MLPTSLAAKASGWLSDYSIEKGIYMKINYFNPEHVHTLIDLPTSKSIEEVVQLFKGSMSHRINDEKVLAWEVRMGQRLPGIFSFALGCYARCDLYRATGTTP
jgi:hypothetical protein